MNKAFLAVCTLVLAVACSDEATTKASCEATGDCPATCTMISPGYGEACTSAGGCSGVLSCNASATALVCTAPERCACSENLVWNTACTGIDGCAGTFAACGADGTTPVCACPSTPGCSAATAGFGTPCTSPAGCPGTKRCDAAGASLVCGAPASCACTENVAWNTACTGADGCAGTFAACGADGTTPVCACPSTPGCSAATAGFGTSCTSPAGCPGTKRCDAAGASLVCGAPASCACTENVSWNTACTGASGCAGTRSGCGADGITLECVCPVVPPSCTAQTPGYGGACRSASGCPGSMVCSGDELVCNAPERCACSQQPAWQTACTGTGGCSGTYDGCEADGTTLRCTCPAAPSCSDQTVGYGAPCTGSSGCRGKQLCDGGALACAAPSSCTSRILFSEVAPGGSGHDEFIELHNSGATSADLSGMKLYYRYDGGSTPLVIPMATIPAGTSVRPGGYFLLTRSGSYTGSVPGDLTFTTNVLTSYYSLWLMKAGNTEADDKTLIKTFSNAGNPITSHPSVVDVASVGSAGIGEGGQPNAWSSSYGTQVSLERKGRASSTAASMAGGGADATLGNGQDSNNSAADFVVRTVRDPQNSQSSVEP